MGISERQRNLVSIFSLMNSRTDDLLRSLFGSTGIYCSGTPSLSASGCALSHNNIQAPRKRPWRDIFYSCLQLTRPLSTQGQLYRDWAFPPHSANRPRAWWTLIGTSSPCFTIFGVIPNLEIISLSRGTACRCPSSTLVLAGRSRRVLREGTDADSAAVPISVNRLSSFSSSKGRSLFECKRSLQGLCRCESFTIMKLLWIQ